MKLDGELTQQRVPELLAQLDTLASAAEIDVSGVIRADSAGLALLLEVARRGTPRLVNAPQQLRTLARFFGVEAALRLA